jgi:hypothetical protein
MARTPPSRQRNKRKRVATPVVLNTRASGEEYRVGPGRPPRQYQFKPGQSGNPKGAKRKAASILPDLKAVFKRAFSKKVTLKQGEKERIVTKFEAGFEQLANQFAQGDRHARRDFFYWAHKLGGDLTAPVRQPEVRLSRKETIAAMRARGIPTGPFYPPQFEHDDDPPEPANDRAGTDSERKE